MLMINMLTTINTHKDVVCSIVDLAKIKLVGCFHTIPEIKHVE